MAVVTLMNVASRGSKMSKDKYLNYGVRKGPKLLHSISGMKSNSRYGNFGVKEIYQSSTASIDIIAVHGLNGDREGSWTADNGVLWFRDLLPNEMPEARILTYGYDAYVGDKDRLSVQTLNGHARDLLVKLATFRRITKTDDRPMIFIAYDLGGIILQFALIQASYCHDSHLPAHRKMFEKTEGIVFLGTPNQATNDIYLDNLNGTSILKINANILDDIVAKHLDDNSEMLKRQMARYLPISRRFMTRYLYGYSGTNPPAAEAVLEGAPVKAESMGLYRIHAQLGKFTSKDDKVYQRLVALLKQIYSESTTTFPEHVVGTLTSEQSVTVDLARKRAESQLGVLLLVEGKSPVVDIIAIHSLDGDREFSWTAPTVEGPKMWLKEPNMLPADAKNARILTYGYNAATWGGMQHLDRDTMHSHAERLITEIMLFRKDTHTKQDRPMIFIAHGMGGIMLKIALIIATKFDESHKEHLADYESFANATFGILFIGTPHQHTGRMTVANMLINIYAINGELDRKLIENLADSAKTWQNDLEAYDPINTCHHIFYECYPTILPNGPAQILVPRQSAVVPGAVNSETIGIHKDHLNLVKFESPSDDDYVMVVISIKLMMRAILQRGAPHTPTVSETPTVMPQTTEFGIKVLTSPTSPNSPKLDILFIHGLDGHRERSFTADKGKMWIKDFLSKDLPDGRILSFGYDGYTKDRSRFSSQTFEDYATDLLSALKYSRLDDEDRPIIFVAHGFGGCIVTSALTIASDCQEGHLDSSRKIFEANRGIICLGTSSDQLLAAMRGSGRTGLPERVEWLARQSCQITASGKINIRYFQEGSTGSGIRKPGSQSPFKDILSSKTYDTLTKFESSKDKNYKQLLHVLREMASFKKSWHHATEEQGAALIKEQDDAFTKERGVTFTKEKKDTPTKEEMVLPPPL